MARKTDNDFAAASSNRHGVVLVFATGNHMLADLYNLTYYANIMRSRCARETVTIQPLLKTKIMIDIK
jgi:hypothetical protein